MKIIWIILAVLSFVGGQIYLLRGVKMLDKLLEKKPRNDPPRSYDDSCRYPDQDVVE